MPQASYHQRSKRDLRREEVIDAAAAVFAEFGYYGASTKAIAERVGIQQGSVYYYFDSKEAALEQVCAKAIKYITDHLTDIAKRPIPVEDRLRAAIASHLKLNPDYSLTFLTQRQFLPRRSRHSVGRPARNYERLIRDMIEEGVANGDFDPNLNCELTVMRLLNECNGIFIWYGKRAKKLSMDLIASAIANGFLSGISVRR